MLLQVLGENFHRGEFSPHQIPDLKSYCKFLGKIFTPSNSWFKKLLQVLGENFLPMKSKQLSYCKIWGAFKINGSDAIASFGGKIFTPSNSWFKKLLQVLGEYFYPIIFRIQKAIASFGGAFKIKAFRPIASFGGEFSPHQIPDLKSYCKFWGKVFRP